MNGPLLPGRAPAGALCPSRRGRGPGERQGRWRPPSACRHQPHPGSQSTPRAWPLWGHAPVRAGTVEGQTRAQQSSHRPSPGDLSGGREAASPTEAEPGCTSASSAAAAGAHPSHCFPPAETSCVATEVERQQEHGGGSKSRVPDGVNALSAAYRPSKGQILCSAHFVTIEKTKDGRAEIETCTQP